MIWIRIYEQKCIYEQCTRSVVLRLIKPLDVSHSTWEDHISRDVKPVAKILWKLN